MSRYELIRWVGLAGLVSGLLILAGGIGLLVVEPIVFGTLFVSGHILLFFVLTGVYSIQHSATGYWGFLGYGLSTIANAMFIILLVVDSLVLPQVEVTGELFPVAVPATIFLFSIGLLFLAVANTRVRALPSWPGWLMFGGVVLNLILPRLSGEIPDFVIAVPPIVLGLGVAGFGWALRRN